MNAVYLGALLVSLAAMVLIDRRFLLVFWHAPVRAVLVVAIGTSFFLGWDLIGIALGIFVHGSGAMTGILLAPELPVEEPIFLVFLIYLTMIVATGATLLLDRRRS